MTAISCNFRKQSKSFKEDVTMYGYFVEEGYKGLVGGKWMLFPTETEYYEYMSENID